MKWREDMTGRLRRVLIFCVRGVLIVNVMILVSGLTYVTFKVTTFTVAYLNRVWFGSPW